MKQIFLIPLMLSLIPASFAQTGKAVTMGLISPLVDIKYNTEAYLVAMMQDPGADYGKALKNYNTLRVGIDQIIWQMAADMKSRNSAKLFRRLNKYYQSHTLSEKDEAGHAISAYAAVLADAFSFYRLNIHPETGTKTIIPVETLLTQGWEIFTGIQEMRANRVDGIIGILNNFRLTSPVELKNAIATE